MIRFKLVKLGDCCEIVSGSTPSRLELDFWNGSIDWFTPKDLSKIDGKYVEYAPEKISEKGYKSCSTNLLPPKTLLFTSRAPIGHLAINLRPCCTNQGFKSLIPSNDVDVEYLYYVIKKNTSQLQSLGNGATFKELSKASLSEFKIPLPPLEEQKKIAAILDAADVLRQKDKAVISKYDELKQALFLDMFGDPVSNPKGWEKREIQEVAEIRGRVGWKGYKKTDLRDAGPLVLGATHLTNEGYVDLEKPVHISEEKFLESPEIKVEMGDLLIVQRGNTIGKVGLVITELEEATINPCILIIRKRNEIVHPQFLRAIFINNKVNELLWSMNNSSAQPMLTQKDLREFRIIMPFKKLQELFAERVTLIEHQKSLAQQALEKSSELFNSLLQKAFKGELTSKDEKELMPA